MVRHVFPRQLAAISIALMLAGVVVAQDGEPTTEPAAPVDVAPVPAPTPPGVGDPLPASLPLLRLGAAAETEPGLLLADVSGDPQQPVVVVFWSLGCPVCRRYADQLSALAGDWRDKANMIVIVSGSDQLAGDARATDTRAAVEGLGLLRATILLDPDGEAARTMGVRVTPTALVADAANVIRYSGPLDDDRRARGRDARALLRPALEAVLAGKAPEIAEARPFGSAVR